MPYNCQVAELAAQTVLSLRRRTTVQELPQMLGTAYAAVLKKLEELGEQPAGPPFAAYYNMDMQDLDVEAGFPVAKELPGAGDLKASEIPAGKVATCFYVGPYNEIEPAYKELMRWIGENGYEATGVAYELYLNDPAQTPPEEWQTQIMMPLK